MESFTFQNGMLFCDQVDVSAIAERYGTPSYVYSARAFREHYRQLHDAFASLNPKICFSIKSCHNLHILRTLRECGPNFDAVSIGEVRRAIEAGALAADIVFAGVGKTPTEIADAIELGVGMFNVESEMEVEVLAAEASRTRKRIRAAVRINPDVDAKTHPYTTTGKDENKFGIEIGRARPLFKRFNAHKHLSLVGVHLHIGSPVNSIEPYVEMVTKALELIGQLRSEGVAMESINIGGGYGANYGDQPVPLPRQYAEAIVPLLADSGLALSLEPGRAIAANAGILLTRIVYLKNSRTKQFIIADAAMTDLLRPALYGAYHHIWPVKPTGGLVPSDRSPGFRLDGSTPVDIVGPVCESCDFLGKDRYLPPVRQGDLLAVFSAGAYGAVMGSQYNSRGRAAEILVDGNSTKLIRRRETYDDLVTCERDV